MFKLYYGKRVADNGFGIFRSQSFYPNYIYPFASAAAPSGSHFVAPCKLKQTFLNCCLFNARSLKSKLLDLRLLLASLAYDLILVVETWLDDSITDSMLILDRSYVLCRRDRGSHAGGIAFLVKKGITFNLISIAADVEAVSFDLGTAASRIILGYIPSNADKVVIKNMTVFIQDNISSVLPNIVVGDFNMSNIDWGNSICNASPQKIFFDCVSNLGLRQLVPKPTRGGNLLDLVLVDNDRVVFDVDVVDHFVNSDHNTVIFRIVSDMPPENSNNFKFSKTVLNHGLLHEVLRVTDWSSILSDKIDTETLDQNLQARLRDAVTSCSTVTSLKKIWWSHLPETN